MNMEINGIYRVCLRDSGSSIDVCSRSCINEHDLLGEYVWFKSPLDEIYHCLPLAKIKIKTKKGEFYTKAAINQDSSDNDLYLLGNRTAELLESNEQGVQLVNAVVTRSKQQRFFPEKEKEANEEELELTDFPRPREGKTIALSFLLLKEKGERVWRKIGFPREIQSYLGTFFTSELTTTFFNKFGIKVTRSSVSHPQSNAVERVHRTIKRVIKALCVESGEDWEGVLPLALFSLRTVAHESTGFSPTELVMGKNLRTPQTRGSVLIVLATSKQNKLEVNWIGPGKVLSRISDTNYVIDLPGRRDRSTIYHVNLLKPYHRRPELVSLVVEEVSDDIEGDAEIPYPDKQCTKFDYHEILRESQLQLKLSPSQIDESKQVITKNKDVFSPDPGTTHLMRMDIELISDKPIKTKPYRMSPRQINILREEIKRLLELGVIEIGQSDYTSPLILVESPNKDPRPCVDYRRLNKITRAEFFPLPNMEEIVEKVSAAPYVTVLDLSKGYFQIPLMPRAQRYADFVTPFGTHIPKKMMFGLVCAPYYFCKLMAQVLEGLEQFALPYIDDIAIFSQGWKDHVKHIDIVLGRLRKAGLKVKPSKCKFAQEEVLFLGHRIGSGSRSPSDLKIKAIADFPRPTTKTQVRSFLGLVGYYSHYIPNYSTIASPLTDALKGKIKKEKITWDEKCGKAFEELKAKLVSNPYCLPQILPRISSCKRTRVRTILDRVLGERAAGVHYRLFSVWTLVPVSLDQQLSDHSTVDEIASRAADCRLTYTMANCPQRRKREREKEEKRARKRQGLVVLGSGEENPRVLLGDADQESETRMSKNVLWTGRRQAVE
ncbi:hypothetical protein TNCV_3062081 [Trichonephila clavipes]|nr:hypothetical protein TNCV_3062081 [Trichonephila clavipes]